GVMIGFNRTVTTIGQDRFLLPDASVQTVDHHGTKTDRVGCLGPEGNIHDIAVNLHVCFVDHWHHSTAFDRFHLIRNSVIVLLLCLRDGGVSMMIAGSLVFCRHISTLNLTMTVGDEDGCLMISVMVLSMVSREGLLWNAGEKRLMRSDGDRVLAGVAFVGMWRMM
ncbi:hypothetical protein A2U01_0050321, partial [Trifolium medium]|nr:hypothetical protein [Trifolium medium]